MSFIYETLKLSTRSLFKLSSANANEATQTLKLLLSETAMKRQLDRKLEMIGVVVGGGNGHNKGSAEGVPAGCS